MPLANTSASTAPFKRELRLLDTTSLVVGTVIGSAVFIIAGSIGVQLKSISFILLIWIVGGILSLFGALSLGELGAMFPMQGGLYVYLRQIYGDLPAFLYGWALFTVIHSGSIAALLVAFSVYSAQLVLLGPSVEMVVRVAVIVAITAANCLGIRVGKIVQNGFTIAKLAGLFGLILVLAAKGSFDRLYALGVKHLSASDFALAPIGTALIAVLWAYEGWHVLSFTAAEIKDPQHNLPRGLLYGVLIVAVGYILANASYYLVLSPEEVRSSSAVAATAMGRAIGPAARVFLSLIILTSVWGAINGMVLTGPRVYYAMATDGLFFPVFKRVNARYRTPVTALVAQGAWTSILACWATYQDLFTGVIFIAWIFYGAAVFGVIVLRIRQPHLARPFRVAGLSIVPLVFCLAAAGLIATTVIAHPRDAVIGISLLLSGLPVYFFFRTRE